MKCRTVIVTEWRDKNFVSKKVKITDCLYAEYKTRPAQTKY